MYDSELLQQLAKRQLEAVIVTPQHGCVALVLVTRRIEMQNFLHY
jgi:hypothetical protein